MSPPSISALVLWSAVCATAAAAEAAAGAGEPIVVAAGAVAAVVMLRPLLWRAMPTIIAMGPLVVDAGPAVWGLTGAGLTLATFAGPAAPAAVTALRRELAVCRRRGSPASVLVVPLDRGALAQGLKDALRSTDAAEVLRVRGRRVLVAVLEEDGLVRAGLEERLASIAADPSLPCGWARFPDEGITLEVLVEHGLMRAPVVQPSPGGAAFERRLSLVERSS